MNIRAIPIAKTFAPAQVIRSEVEKAIEKERANIIRELGITSQTWSNKPRFTARIIGTPQRRIIQFYTDSQVWNWLDEGTDPHPIAARNAPRLRFYRTGFVSKTVPNRLNPRAGRRANRNFITPLVVQHPGTKARNWSALIMRRSQKRLKTDIPKAIQRGASRIKK